jgi:hypothetical protein
MDATIVLIIKLHKKVKKYIVIFQMLKYFNVNLRFIGRILERYKATSEV